MRPTTSASNLFRRFLCPGSARLEEGLPEQDTPQSKEGELLHDYSAHRNYERSVLKPNQRDLLELCDQLQEEVMERVGCPKNQRLIHEQRIVGIVSGTPDLIINAPKDKAVLVIDRKFGYKVVERADLNIQLRVYAILVYDWLDKVPRKVFVSILQPRLRYEERITIAEYLPEDIEASRVQVQSILEAASKPDAPLVAGEQQCRYCRARLICPEFRKTFGDLVPFTPDTDLTVAAREAYLQKRLAECSDTELEKVLTAIAFARIIKDAATDEARQRISAGQLTNYELSKPYTVRNIADSQRAISLLTLAGIRSREQLLAIADLPLGRIEEDYRKATGCTAKDAREKINAVLNTVLEKEERKPRVIRK